MRDTLNTARRELRESMKNPHRELTPAQLARRRILAAEERYQSRAALAQAGDPDGLELMTADERARYHDEHPDTRPVYLIACSAAKLEHRAPARELYTGQAFRFAMEAASRAGAEVWILSALHGLVHPDTQLDPYNVTLSEMPAADRAAWTTRTAAQLEQLKGRRVTVLAGSQYAASCGALDATYPLAGLGIGEQLAALKYMHQPKPRTTPRQQALDLN